MADGHHFKGYLPGGASGGILPAYMADIPLDFGQLEKHGCFVGSHAVVILSDKDDMKAVALNLMRFFEDESCGQCTPCRNGTEKAVKLMAAGRLGRRAARRPVPGHGGCLHLRPGPGRPQPGQVRVQVFPGGPAVSAVIPGWASAERDPDTRASALGRIFRWLDIPGMTWRNSMTNLPKPSPRCRSTMSGCGSSSGDLRRGPRRASMYTGWTTWWCRSGNGRLKLVSPAGRGELRRAEAVLSARPACITTSSTPTPSSSPSSRSS